MKRNPHSLEYKKQKALIADWMFEGTCRYYHEFGSMFTENDRKEIMKEVFGKIENLAIWVPFEEVYTEYLKNPTL